MDNFKWSEFVDFSGIKDTSGLHPIPLKLLDVFAQCSVILNHAGCSWLFVVGLFVSLLALKQPATFISSLYAMCAFCLTECFIFIFICPLISSSSGAI